MKKIYYLIFTMIATHLLNACIQDDTSLADPNFPTISINAQYDTLSVNLSEEFVYKVEVVQSGEERPLTYEWGYATYNPKDEDYPAKDSLKIISREAELHYTFRKLGTYYLRLKVDNGEAITFKGFLLNVTTPYDEGITILSQDDGGNPRVSFMKTLTRQEIESGMEKKFVTDVLTKENPDYVIKNCTDMGQFGSNYLLLASREDGVIYKLNAKTFGVIYKNRVRDVIPDFTCVELMGEKSTNWMLADNGNAYRYDLTFDEILTIDNAIGYGYDACFFGYSASYQYFIDYDKSIIYSPTGLKATSSSTFFEDYDIIGMVPWTITKLYTIAVSKQNPKESRVFQTSGSLSKLTELIKFDATDLKMDKNSTLLFSKVTKFAYYDYGNNIYRWNCTGQFPQTPFIKYPITKEITALSMDADKKLIYVCYVDSERSGLKGGLDIYDADTGNLMESHEGIADRPLRVFYKTK